MLLTTGAYAATSYTTLSNMQTSAKGSLIEQNEGKGILGGTWTGGDTLTVHAMMVKS